MGHLHKFARSGNIPSDHIAKSYQQPLSSTVQILKIDQDQHLVYGVVLIPDIQDAQGDIISRQDVQQAAHQFVADYSLGKSALGDNHTTQAKNSNVVESYIAPQDLSINNKAVSKGSWVLVSKVLDKRIWRKIKDGTYTGYSIGGRGQRQSIN